MPNYIGYEPSFGIPPRDRFTGDGTTTVFNLSKTPGSADAILVSVSGVLQDSNTYSVVGTTLTFQDPPPAAVPTQNAANIEVNYFGRQTLPYMAARSALTVNGFTTFTATGSIPTSALGTSCLINSASATTLTLPAANSVAPGASIEFLNINSGASSIQRAGADTIQPNASTVTSITLGAGDSLLLRSDGSSKWYSPDGTAQSSFATLFSKSHSTSGYQKLPGGLIVQWGTGSFTAAGAAVTFPLAFPTNAFIVSAGSNTAGQLPAAGSITTTGFTGFTTSGTVTHTYIAIGN